ncbi:MAG TPA: SRPBCC domain-containing protein [Devosia sp.]|jgi:uncharacterized protein YndB with AHSA1/START domain|uniref:SRPBCC domain-containing protein n=1 Tax=Devosia sp. TaxID=1871048 RepID=UPI002DDCF00F|nr:SRPBCC domain-containing protein [Devosia sp.]HEV2516239.1 SRPBCC domain-containing protein [Devosia sp.]
MVNETLDRQTWQVIIAAPPETVWRRIVRTDEVLPFLFGAICQTEDGLVVGKSMRMASKDGRHVVAYGKVLDVSAPTRYSHSINFTMAPDEIPGVTTYELGPVPGGTKLTLVSDVVAGTQTAKMGGSGRFIVDNLKSLVETGKPTFGGRLIMAMAPFMSAFTPKNCRIENWPFSRVRLSGE